MKGGILSGLSERNMIIAWVRTIYSILPYHPADAMMQRLCQSGSPVEAQELLEGLKSRCIVLGVPEPEMAVVDNCCSVRNQLTKAMPDLQVVLDFYHFLMRCVSKSRPCQIRTYLLHPRYLIVIIDGTKNPHRSMVAKDITDAILKTRATGAVAATYWDKGKQEEQLQAVYEKWLRKGKVWSAAASNVSPPNIYTGRKPLTDTYHLERHTMSSLPM